LKKTGIFQDKINIVFMFACLFGLIIRIYPDGRSLWVDELYSVTTAYGWNSLYEMFWGEMVYETHPPLYQSILYYWIRLFGDSDYIVRVPSIIFGVSSVCTAYLYGGKLFGKKEALLITALLAVSWGGIYYSHEARNYSLLLLLSVILMLKSLKLIMSEDMNFRDASELFVIGFLICHTHYFGSLLYFSNLIVLMSFLNVSRRRIFFLGLFSMTAFAPWLFLNISHMTGKRASWIAAIPVHHHFMGFFTLFMASKCAFGTLVMFALYRTAFQSSPFLIATNRRISYSLSVILLVILFSLLITTLYKPIIITRNLIVLLPYSYLIVSVIFSDTVSNEQSGKGRLFIIPSVCLSAGLVFVMMISAFLNFITYEKQDWRGTANSIKLIKNIDKIYCIGGTPKYRHYLRKSDLEKNSLINVKKDGIKLISKPKEGTVSILWSGYSIYKYNILKKAVAEKGFDLIKEEYFGSRGISYNSCAYAVFK